jgi:hypothetical protein
LDRGRRLAVEIKNFYAVRVGDGSPGFPVCLKKHYGAVVQRHHRKTAIA